MCGSNLTTVSSAVPRAWWRSVENSFNGFAVESFIDELAAAAGQDPVQFRRSLLVKPPNWKPRFEDDPDPARLLGVLNLVAEKSGWAKPLPKGRGRGVACFHSFGSYFAEVAEVTVKGSDFKIDRIVAAVDCGQIVNPESVRSQTEGAIIYGLSAALKNEITIKNGAVEQTNFDGYDPHAHQRGPADRSAFAHQQRRSRRDGRAGAAAACARRGECDFCRFRAAIAEDAVSVEGSLTAAGHSRNAEFSACYCG